MPYFGDAQASDPSDPSVREDLLRRLASEDPSEALQLKLAVRERIIRTIEARLKEHPADPHQRFLLEEHLAARAAMLEELRRLNLEKDLRCHDLDAFVSEYVQALEAEPDPEQAQEQASLEHERQSWEDLIAKVRARLLKRPGDPQLMRLLGEHQARLLNVQESLHALKGAHPFGQTPKPAAGAIPEQPEEPAAPPVELVLEQLPATRPHSAVHAIERELEVFIGMVEKTRQRLAAKPELGHLTPLIKQHEARIEELKRQIEAARAAHPPEASTEDNERQDEGV
ncbi:MAG: hypothetical protein ACAI44_36015 [Candidatus Sericytochromatia bacterium]